MNHWELLQEEHERDIVKAFLASYNAKHLTAFSYLGRSDDAQELLLRDGTQEMRAVLSTAHYDMLGDRILWMPGPPRRVGPRILTGFDFESVLTRTINQEIADRCKEDSSGRCVLLISVHPNTTTTRVLIDVLDHVKLPAHTPFEGIYFVAHVKPVKHRGGDQDVRMELDVRQLA